ncbi:MAG: Gfo/Idh/MocA family oxidoreductase [Ferruginibacter sp.]
MQPVKTAVLSFGLSGKVFHAPFIDLHPGFELTGIWERSKKLIGEIYPGVTSYDSLEEILADDTIELVVVNTPTATHYGYAKQVLQAGKHAIVEKAFTTTVEEAVELKELAEQYGKKLSVFQNRRWDSDFRTVKKILEEGWLGEIIEAEIHYERYKPDLSIKQHKETPGVGSGLLKDLGPHLIDQAICLFGMPESLFADLRIIRQASQVNDWFDILLFYPGLRFRLKSSLLVKEPLPGYVFHGSKGSFIKGRTDIQENELLAGKKPNTDDWGTEPESEAGLLSYEKDGVSKKEKIKSLQGNYYGYYDEMYKAIRENAPLPVTAEDGIRVMRIIEAAIQSSNEKKLVCF